MDYDRARRYIKAAYWRVAATMPDIPHSYTQRAWRADLIQEFLWFARMIREHGKVECFYGQDYTYLYVDGKKYWAMGILINRADL